MAGSDADPGHAPGHELVRVRAELGLTRQELAELAGIDEAELAEFEAGTRPITHEFLAEIMEELNVKGA